MGKAIAVRNSIQNSSAVCFGEKCQYEERDSCEIFEEASQLTAAEDIYRRINSICSSVDSEQIMDSVCFSKFSIIFKIKTVSL
ncbi:hypothetical protein CEXT_510691 [Caerostris extrusa]|uniref:Uncharacterized protein n=1 Tax=Caerostris extrusa TaxID=172846 RepID=A0AAV4XQ24_CAEEX|nr:hypothetical protein CEXT_510691 [Caerostris extrusa]